MKLLLGKLLFVFAFVLTSCMSPRVYVPAMPATPLFEKKKDVYTEFNGNVFGMTGACFGAALTDNIGAYAAVSAHFGSNDNELFSPKNSFTTKTVNYTFGLGMFRNRIVSEKKRLEGFVEYTSGVFEASASSKKTINSKPVYQNAFLDGKYNQWSVNLNRSIKDENALMCISLGLGFTHFFDYTNEMDEPIDEVMARLKNDKLFGFGDLGFNFMLGKGAVKFKCQLLMSYSIMPLNIERNLGVNFYNTFGLVYMPR
ncbi:MAG TPA: hypothetical protein VGF79_15630 [Bacteroidia bacterium]